MECELRGNTSREPLWSRREGRSPLDEGLEEGGWDVEGVGRGWEGVEGFG